MIGPLTTCVSVATLLLGMLVGSALAKVQGRLHIIIMVRSYFPLEWRS